MTLLESQKTQEVQRKICIPCLKSQSWSSQIGAKSYCYLTPNDSVSIFIQEPVVGHITIVVIYYFQRNT